jgi:hypothetical protein
MVKRTDLSLRAVVTFMIDSSEIMLRTDHDLYDSFPLYNTSFRTREGIRFLILHT